MSFLQPNGQVIDLGINITHVGTLRNARGTPYPDPIQAALLAEQSGADGITLHLRTDHRDTSDADLDALRLQLLTRMNLELAMTPEMLDLACRIKPQEVCLVPDCSADLTAQAGLDVAGSFAQIQAAIKQLQSEGVRVILLVDPDTILIAAAAEAGAETIKLHTGRYALAATDKAQQTELEYIRHGVQEGLKRGLRVSAGHGLHYTNVHAIAAISGIAQINIGHAIVARALFTGWQNAVREMKALMTAARLEGQAK